MNVPQDVSEFRVVFTKADHDSIWASRDVQPNTSQNHPCFVSYTYSNGMISSSGGQWRPTEYMLHQDEYPLEVDMSDETIVRATATACIYNGDEAKITKITFNRV